MQLNALKAVNFKNLSDVELSFSLGVNCFLGLNGSGKTNILDAIYYLAYTKSYFNSAEALNVKFDENFFLLQSEVTDDQEDFSIHCGYKLNEKKVFKKNKRTYTKLSDHIGTIPVVMISPNDTNLILEGGLVRRKFMNAFISQFDKEYLSAMQNYNKLLMQRNKHLKSMAETRSVNHEVLDILDLQIAPLGNLIAEKRRNLAENLVPIFNKYYKEIAQSDETVGLLYESSVHEDNFSTVLKESRNTDLRATHSTAGIHKDDLIFTIHNHPLKKIGSQGQQKTFLIALKLATLDYIKSQRNFTPILLLDDIFDKLDDRRIEYLLHLIETNQVGQTFITDTSLTKVPDILSTLNVSFKAYNINKGNVSELNLNG